MLAFDRGLEDVAQSPGNEGSCLRCGAPRCGDAGVFGGGGLLLDLHGQAAQADAIFRGTQNGKTVKLLDERFGVKALTGPDSVQGRLEKKGYKLIPAGASTDPEDKRFNGGYTVGTYGTNTGLDAIQLEMGGDQRLKKTLDTTATDIADAVAAFAKEYLPKERKR